MHFDGECFHRYMLEMDVIDIENGDLTFDVEILFCLEQHTSIDTFQYSRMDFHVSYLYFGHIIDVNFDSK